MLLEDFKEKINKGEYTSSVSLPASLPINRDDLPDSSSPPSNEVTEQPTASPQARKNGFHVFTESKFMESLNSI